MKQPALLTVLLLVFLPTASPAQAGQAGKLLPADEAAREAEFFSFRAHLQAAVARRDAEAVLAIVHPDIKNTFGGDDGKDAFRRIWRITEGGGELWEVLGTVLALGGTFRDENTFVAPYVFSRWPASFDSFEYLAVLGSEVRVRARPGLEGPVLTFLSFDIVERSSQGGHGGEWTAVKLKDGRAGYIASRYVRSPVDYRAFFSRQDGRWRMTLLIAGD